MQNIRHNLLEPEAKSAYKLETPTAQFDQMSLFRCQPTWVDAYPRNACLRVTSFIQMTFGSTAKAAMDLPFLKTDIISFLHSENVLYQLDIPQRYPF